MERSKDIDAQGFDGILVIVGHARYRSQVDHRRRTLNHTGHKLRIKDVAFNDFYIG